MDDRVVARSAAPRNKSKRRGKRWIGTLAVIGAVSATGALGYLLLRPEPVLVEVATVARKPIESAIRQDGRTRLRNPYSIAAPVAGKLQRITLRAGDRVEKGQILATILPPDSPLLDGRSASEADARWVAASAAVMRAKAAVTGAKAGHALAEHEAERIRVLFQQNVSSASELERAEAEERLRASELNTAELGVQVAWSEAAAVRASSERASQSVGMRINTVVVQSPISGVVMQVYSEHESPVAIGTPLVQVGDPTDLEVVAEVLTTQAVSIAAGAQTTISGWGGADLRGHVRTVLPSALTKMSALGIEEQRVPVVIELDEQPSGATRLGDGFAVDVSIITQRQDDAIVLPVGALHASGSSYGTFVVDDSGVAHERSVQVLMMNPHDAAALDGVRPGERVILHPTDRVHDRVRVRVRP